MNFPNMNMTSSMMLSFLTREATVPEIIKVAIVFHSARAVTTHPLKVLCFFCCTTAAAIFAGGVSFVNCISYPYSCSREAFHDMSENRSCFSGLRDGERLVDERVLLMRGAVRRVSLRLLAHQNLQKLRLRRGIHVFALCFSSGGGGVRVCTTKRVSRLPGHP